jgi:hypothetical protein
VDPNQHGSALIRFSVSVFISYYVHKVYFSCKDSYHHHIFVTARSDQDPGGVDPHFVWLRIAGSEYGSVSQRYGSRDPDS